MQWYLFISVPFAYIGIGVLFTAIMKKINGETQTYDEDLELIALWPFALLLLIVVGPILFGMFLLEKLMEK